MWIALVIHVTDEAMTGFLSVYNPTVLALREKLGFWPMPPFGFREWLTSLAIGIGVLALPAPATQVGSAEYVKLPIRLRGKMWWNDPATPGRLEEFVLREDALAFAVIDMEDHEPYRATLQRHSTERNRFEGALRFVGETETASCELRHCADGTYELKGKWSQSTSPEIFDWNAQLELDDE